jgi:CRP-like cAMP-binding protein
MTTLNLFRNATDIQSYTAGQTIFEAGALGDVMYVVQEGDVDIVLAGRVIDSAGAGGIIGEMALISDKPRSASAVARTDCKLVPIDEKRFTFLVQQTPYFSIQVMRVIAERLRRYMEAAA